MIVSRLLPRDSVNRLLMAAFYILWAASCIRLPHPEYFAMQHVPTVLAVIALTVLERRRLLDRLGFALVIAFLLLHLLGARYLYSFVPYDDWFDALFGVRPTDRFGLTRNHYDRLVHFSFGLLFVYPLAHFFQHNLRLIGWWPAVLSVTVIIAAGALYEIAEWLTALAFAPDWAEAYNGQQGDLWDAQRDMALAVVGAVVAGAFIAFRQNNSRPTAVQS